MSQKLYAGFDLGSRTSKIVLFHSNKIVYNHVTDTGINPRKTANRLLEDALKSIKIHKSDILKIYATGEIFWILLINRYLKFHAMPEE